jgi:hypothetical protein
MEKILLLLPRGGMSAEFIWGKNMNRGREK